MAVKVAMNRRAVLVAGLCLSLVGCADTVQWQEEVRLQGGRIVTVTQKRRCDGGVSVSAAKATCVSTDAWLTFQLSETAGEEVTWHERLNPMVLNVHDGRVYVVGYPIHPSEFRIYGGTNPPYVGFVLHGTTWQRIPFERIPIEIYEGNLLIESIPKTRTKHLSLALKEGSSENGDPRYPMYLRRIDPKHARPLL